MKIMKRIILTIAVLMAALPSFAQTLRSAYFMDGYNYRHLMNPALASERSYFSLPGMGGLGSGLQSNLGVNSFLYPMDGGLTTFMSSSVEAGDFLGKLKQNNRITASLDASVLSLGIWGRKAFYTFDINAKAESNVNIPYSLFDFMKNAGKSQYYDISDLAANAEGRVEFAFGYSRKIADLVNVGARLKFLVGVANADARIDKMHVQMTGDQWSVNSRGMVKVSSSLVEARTKGETGTASVPEEAYLVDDVRFVDAGSWTDYISGYGAAIDLGAEAALIPGLKVSLAVKDLGFISWNHTTVAETGDRSWYFNGFDNVSFDEGKDNSISEQFKDLGDDLAGLADFRRTGMDGSRTKMLAMTLNAGVDYTMPFYYGLSAGVLSSTHFNGPFTWAEGRFYANLEPCTWFSFGVNYAISTFGSSMGAVLGFHAPGFSMFIGSDSLCFKYAKAADVEGLPFPLLYPYGKLRIGLNFGISFNVGSRRNTGLGRTLVNL